MASESSCPCRFPYRNLLLVDPMENELAKDPGPVGCPHSGGTSPAPSRNPSLGLALVPALISPLTPAPVPTNELFKQFMKAYLKSNQGPK